MNEAGFIFDIKKFAIHDGPGIRTTVFVKGCPLRCQWCHNPESQHFEREISFLSAKCIGCGWCFRECPHGCHTMENGAHVFHREACTRCGRCTLECYAQALESVGRTVTVEEVLAEVLKDKPFYEHSGGGMTISGGEPMAQFEFTRALLHAAKAAGIHTALDTCGQAALDHYLAVLPDVDVVLFDLKATDDAKHQAFTGVKFAPIYRNLQALDRAGATLLLRCPLIPGLNDDDAHLRRIGEIAEELPQVQEVTLHPYHPLGESKCERMGYAPGWKGPGFAEDETVQHWLDAIRACTTKSVRKA